MISNFETLNNASAFKDLKINFKDLDSGQNYEIARNLLDSCEFQYQDFDITGYITFRDLFDINNNLNTGPNLQIDFSLKDVDDGEYKRTFVVTKITSSRQQNFDFVRLELRDIISYTLDNIFESKSYNTIKLSDIFKEFLDKTEKANLKVNISETKERKLYIVNQTKSILDFLIDDLEREGFILYQDKDSINLKSCRDLVPSKLEQAENLYTDKQTNQLYGFRIIEFKQLNNKDIKKIDPKIHCIVYNPETKTMDVFKQNLEDIENELKLNKGAKAQETKGIKYTTKEYLDDNSLFASTFKRYIKDSQLEIIVPGNIKESKLYRKLETRISGNINVQESQDKGNEKLSGIYICTKIVDKLINGSHFIQKLILSRLDNKSK